MMLPKLNKLAVWAVTPNGAKLTDRLADGLPDADVYVSRNLAEKRSSHIQFETRGDSERKVRPVHRPHLYYVDRHRRAGSGAVDTKQNQGSGSSRG